MNLLAHVCLTYFFLSFFLPDARAYLLPIAFFSIVLDLDHVSILFKITTPLSKVKPLLSDAGGVTRARLMRTALQEPIGILLLLSILAALSLFGVQSILLFIAAFSFVLHWAIDFLTGTTFPFTPFSDFAVTPFFRTTLQKAIKEITLTALSVFLFLAVYR